MKVRRRKEYVQVFGIPIQPFRTPRSCRSCLKPATHEVYKADQRRQPNMSSVIFVCEADLPPGMAEKMKGEVAA